MPKMINRKLHSWASIADEKAVEQAEALSRLPFIHPHIALMPDVHAGKGSAVGTVIPTRGAVIPAAVGVDIGCGMIAVETRYNREDIENLNLGELRDKIEKEIPLSPGNYNKYVHYEHTQSRVKKLEELAERLNVDLSHSPKWREQLGSLGGGNHFIELCLDGRDHVWLILHSGSRGVGNKIAQKHIKIAQKLMKKWHIQLEDTDHAYLPEGVPEFSRYLKDLQWAQAFAMYNRDEMMDRFVTQFGIAIGTHDFDSIEVKRINCHHNYTERQNMRGSNVWLTRKGAIKANRGTMGLIPGSMGAKSYIVRGLGNEHGLYSAPHGAGRVLSRTQAKKRFTADDLASRMGEIVYRHGDAWVDEIPDAYKPIDQVMEDASDLVEVVHELRQIMNVKGT